MAEPRFINFLQFIIAATGKQPYWKPQQITSLTLHADTGGKLTFSFRNNATQSYALKILNMDFQSLNWIELDAMLDCFAIAAPGSDISNDLFDHFVCSLRAKFSRFYEPQYDVRTRFAAVLPGCHYQCPHGPHSLISFTIYLREDEVVARAQTSARYMYLVALRTALPQYGLSSADCRFLVYVLQTLHQGASMPPDYFLADALLLRETCGSVRFEHLGEGGTVLKLTFRADTDGRKEPPPQEVLDAALRAIGPSSSLFRVSECPQSPQQSPYPLITYVKKLREDRNGEVYLAIRRHAACAVRVFSEEFDSQSFFSFTIKQLLIMPHHRNVCGVFDSFQVPKPAIPLESLEGEVSADLVARQTHVVERVILKLVLNIAEGLNFLHTYGFVHHNFSLYNVMLNEQFCPVIIGVEFGSTEIK